MYDLKFLPSALQDMLEIIKYISTDLCNPSAADLLSDKFINAAEALMEFPYANAVYHPIKPLKYEYRKLTVKNYIMFYYVDELNKCIVVSRVIYAKGNYNESLK